MVRTSPIIIFFLQVGITLISLVAIYLIFALLDYQGGIDGIVGFTFVQPIIAVILSLATIISVIIVGLPIRLNKNINAWWSNHLSFTIVLLLVGLSLLGASLLPSFVEQKTLIENGVKYQKSVPNLVLSVSGWLLTAFSTLHAFPPKNLFPFGEEK